MDAQQSELDKVKAKIRAMCNMTEANGCSEAEAFSAMEKVGKLLEIYGLSMDDVQARREKCVTRIIPTGSKILTPMGIAFNALSKLCDCKAWSDRQGPEGRLRLNLFGMEPDTMLAEHLYHVINRAMISETRRYADAHPKMVGSELKVAKRSLQLGMADRICDRVADLVRERKKAAGAKQTGQAGTAVTVALKQQIVDKAFGELDIRLRSNNTKSTISNRDAYAHGKIAGDRISFERPIHGNGGPLLIGHGGTK